MFDMILKELIGILGLRPERQATERWDRIGPATCGLQWPKSSIRRNAGLAVILRSQNESQDYESENFTAPPIDGHMFLDLW